MTAGVRERLFGRNYWPDAEGWVAVFSRSCPPPSKLAGKAPSEKLVSSALQLLLDSVAKFSCDNRLGVIARARLAKSVQDVMLAQDYPADLVGRITSALAANALTLAKSR